MLALDLTSRVALFFNMAFGALSLVASVSASVVFNKGRSCFLSVVIFNRSWVEMTLVGGPVFSLELFFFSSVFFSKRFSSVQADQETFVCTLVKPLGMAMATLRSMGTYQWLGGYKRCLRQALVQSASCFFRDREIMVAI